MTTIGSVFTHLVRHPGEMLLRRWNWKSALYSSIVRSLLFLFLNLRSGWQAAAGAMMAEFTYRAATAGFYGALTQSFRKVEPRWQGNVVALGLLTVLSHSIEFAIHYTRGTPNLAASIAGSCLFTAISTLFNLHAMRHGVLVTGGEGYTVLEDLRRLPEVLYSLVSAAPRQREAS